ncbi:MAG: hypothetical protein M3O70_26930, partial [Actinomycetota bacterium]|nr:hypothetical protein [Actinomycetota bacterium]
MRGLKISPGAHARNPQDLQGVDEPVGPLAAEPEAPATGRRGERRGLVVVYAVTVFLLITVNFFLPRALPGDPIDALIDTGSPAHVHDEALRAKLE